MEFYRAIHLLWDGASVLRSHPKDRPNVVSFHDKMLVQRTYPYPDLRTISKWITDGEFFYWKLSANVFESRDPCNIICRRCVTYFSSLSLYQWQIQTFQNKRGSDWSDTGWIRFWIPSEKLARDSSYVWTLLGGRYRNRTKQGLHQTSFKMTQNRADLWYSVPVTAGYCCLSIPYWEVRIYSIWSH